jgi:hypothetical protein
VPAGDHGFTRFDGSQRMTLFGESRAGSTVNRTRHSSAHPELGIRGIDDSRYVSLRGYVASNTLDRDARYRLTHGQHPLFGDLYQRP